MSDYTKTKQELCGWFEYKVSAKTNKQYGSGSFSPKDLENMMKYKTDKWYVNFFWRATSDWKPQITLLEPREPYAVSTAKEVFDDKYNGSRPPIWSVPF